MGNLMGDSGLSGPVHLAPATAEEVYGRASELVAEAGDDEKPGASTWVRQCSPWNRQEHSNSFLCLQLCVFISDSIVFFSNFFCEILINSWIRMQFKARPTPLRGWGGFLPRQSLQHTQMQPGIFQRLEAQGRSAGGRAEKSWHPRGRISSIFGGKRQVLLDHKLDPQKEHSFEESLV